MAHLSPRDSYLSDSLWLGLCSACLITGCGRINYEASSGDLNGSAGNVGTLQPAGGNGPTDRSTANGVSTNLGPCAVGDTACISALDLDRDGYCIGGGINLNPEEDGDCNDPGEEEAQTVGDCRDDNPNIHPDAKELCNFVDDNCEDGVDEAGACPDDCQPMIVGEIRWLVCDSYRSWDIARSSCRAVGAGWDLARVDSEQKMAISSELVMSNDAYGGLWTSGSDQGSEGSYVWEDTGAPLDAGFALWNPEEPSDSIMENCVQVTEKQGLRFLSDAYCSDFVRYLCEYSPQND